MYIRLSITKTMKKEIIIHEYSFSDDGNFLVINTHKYRLSECIDLLDADCIALCTDKDPCIDEDGMRLGSKAFDWDLFEEFYLNDDFLIEVVLKLKKV